MTRRLFLPALFLFSVPLFAQTPEETTRRFLSLAVEGRFAELTRASGAKTEKFERLMRNKLRVRSLRTEAIAVRMHPDRPAADVELALAKHDRQTNAPMGSEVIPLRVELAREGERWLVSAIAFPDDELAAQLLSSSDTRAEPTPRLARALYERALAFLNGGKFADAGRAATMARAMAVDAGDRATEALAAGALMFVRILEQDYAAAERLMEESMALAAPLSDPDVLARVWYNRGRFFAVRPGPNVTAERDAAYRNAHRFAQRAEDPTLLVRVLVSMSIVATNQSDHLAARRYVDESLEIVREIGDVIGEVTAEASLAMIYDAQHDRERYLFHQYRALRLAEKAHGYAHASLLVRTAHALIEEKRFDEARALLDKVLTMDARGVVTAKQPVSELATAINTLALIEAEAGRLDTAECLLRQAGKEMEDRFLFHLSPYRLRRGDAAGALDWALASLAERKVFNSEVIAALIAAARAYRELGQSERALNTLLEAIEMLEERDTRVAGDEKQRAVAADDIADTYDLAAEMALDRKDALQALMFVERGRARVLTDLLENGRPRAGAELDAAQREEQSRRERELARLRIELERAQAGGNRRAVQRLSQELQEARFTYATFVDGIRARSELRREPSRSFDPSAVLEVARRLPPHTAAVEYFVSDEALHIFVVRDARVIHRTKKVQRKVVEERVTRYVEMLAATDLRIDAEARRLHELLIEPVARDLDGASALLVVPDGTLWRVPFAALRGPDGRFLVERSAIVYAPSITAFAAMADRGTARKPAALSLFAVGNPTLDRKASQVAASFYRQAALGPLPDAEVEVDAVQALYGRGRTLVLKREQGTEARTKAAMGGAAIVHFATHALFDDANPMYSRLALAHDESAPEDGWLESWEVARLDLAADIVVLSACDTARGRTRGGEGVVGMAWSFFLAGAQATVATQWKIASDSTADFMIGFHKALLAKKGEPALQKAEALRAAQLGFLRDPNRRHPFHWAAFVLLGDPSS